MKAIVLIVEAGLGNKYFLPTCPSGIGSCKRPSWPLCNCGPLKGWLPGRPTAVDPSLGSAAPILVPCRKSTPAMSIYWSLGAGLIGQCGGFPLSGEEASSAQMSALSSDISTNSRDKMRLSSGPVRQWPGCCLGHVRQWPGCCLGQVRQ